MDVESEKTKISSIFQILENSSIHALPNIFRNEHKSIKLVWFIFFLVSSGGCAYVCYRSVNDYLEFDVVTKIEIKSLDKVNFPMIRICDLNILRTAFAKERVKEILNLYGLNLSTYDNPTFVKENQSQFLINYRLNRYLLRANAAEMNVSEKNKIGKSLEQLIISCVYSLQTCNLNEFETYYDFAYGNCFLFNSGKDALNNKIIPKKSSQSGELNGLSLEFLIGSVEKNNAPFGSSNGLSIYITDQDDIYPFTNGVNILPGYNTDIIIQRTNIIKQPSPFSECTADLTSLDSYESDIYKATMNANSHYNLKSCELMCYQKHVGSRCKCRDTRTPPFYSDVQPCLRYDLYLCNIKTFREFLSLNSFSKCDCPKECETITFTYSISTSEYPTMSYAKSLLNNPEVLSKLNKTNVTYDDLRKNLAFVNIFYNDISEQFVTQNPKMGLFDLISSIGGILGLFLGMSLLSFIEFIEIMMQSCFIWFDKKNNIKSIE